MQIDLKNPTIYRSFTNEIEKNAINWGKVVSTLSPLKKIFTKASKETAKKTKFGRIIKDLGVGSLVGAGVLGAGGVYGAIKKPREIRVPNL